MPDRLQSELARRGRTAFALGVSVLAAATVANYAIGCLAGMNAGYGKKLLSVEDDHWEITECIYAAAITLTTVGYTDVLGTEQLEVWQDAAGRYRWVSPTDGHEDPGFQAETAVLLHDWSPVTRLTSALLAIVGIAFFLYVIAQVTSFFVEGAYEQLRSVARARRRIARFRDHIIVCGAGEHGLYVVEALRADGVPCAVIESSDQAAAVLRSRDEDVPVLIGDATEEDILREAGLARARGVITVLGEDGLNVVVAVTARQLRPGIGVVSRGFGQVSARRLARAGCAVVVSGRLAAMRLASEMVRPAAVDFLDMVLGGEGEQLQLADVLIGESFAGHQIVQSDSVGVVPIAVRRAGNAVAVYNPRDDELFGAGDLLTAIGTPTQLRELRALVGSDSASTAEGEHDDDALAAFDAPLSVGSGAPAFSGAPSDHYLVCGAGEGGAWICRELYSTLRAFVLVEIDEAKVEALRREMPEIQVVVGDATDPDVLRQAGVMEARGLASTLSDDRINLLIVVTALQAQPALNAASLAHDDASARRLRRAGVRVVSMGRIGGRRMATEMIRPQVTGFLDRMLGDPRGLRVESARVVAGAPGAGRTLGEIDFWESTGVRPVAVRRPHVRRREFVFDPGPDVRLEPDASVIVVGSPDDLRRVVDLVGSYE
jgi:voltage-gated potassium channel